MPVREQNSWAEELRAAREIYRPSDRPPDATPPDGPDPYGSGREGGSRWLEIDWRAHMHSADVGGARTHYVEMGTGPVILFVHGLGGSWQNWLENIPHFADSHRVIAVDLPGFGASPLPPWEISIPAYGRFIHDFCDVVGIDKATVVGSSLGGFVTSELAISHPARVERQVLVSSAGVTWSRARREPAQVLGRIIRAASPLAFRYQMEGLRRPRLRQAAYSGMVDDPRSLDPRLLFEITLPALGAPAFYDAMTTLVGYDIRERLEEIEVPTLIVWGRNDRVVPVRSAPYYRELIGDNAELVVFNRCGHLPMMERPVRFNRLLDNFLRQ
jgi:pimeloyl-ACP methyl ester carboxylesterase